MYKKTRTRAESFFGDFGRASFILFFTRDHFSVRVPSFIISLLTVVHLRTVQSGCILILPIFASEVLVLVCPGESSHELGIVAVSSTGTSSFGSCGDKILESSRCTANIRKFTQVPCHPARWIEKSTFLLPEVMDFFIDFATSPEIDERVFYDFLWPYLKGRPQKICTQRKMIETNEANEISKGSPYGHVRFGLHALLVHALHLPQDVQTPRCICPAVRPSTLCYLFPRPMWLGIIASACTSWCLWLSVKIRREECRPSKPALAVRCACISWHRGAWP